MQCSKTNRLFWKSGGCRRCLIYAVKQARGLSRTQNFLVDARDKSRNGRVIGLRHDTPGVMPKACWRCNCSFPEGGKVLFVRLPEADLCSGQMRASPPECPINSRDE
ncbi:hypothetical protein KCP70_20125 [Salmonella enterica subsp. enterica]|nr:hypothetical protein KCP70_20125 [Salmonella enterica subsp. enterica]